MVTYKSLLFDTILVALNMCSVMMLKSVSLKDLTYKI